MENGVLVATPFYRKGGRLMNKVRIAAATALLLMVMAVPSIRSSAATCGETVRQNTEAALKAVDYSTDPKVAELLAPPNGYTFIQISNKKVEIANRDGKDFNKITDEEALAELKQENAQAMCFGDAFAEVQGEIGPIIQRVVDNTANAQSTGAASFTEKILQNKEKLLMGLAYVEKLYDFNMGEKNIRDVLLYEPGAYGIKTNVLDWLIKIGNAGNSTLKISNNTKVFGWGKLFWDVTASASLDAFLEENRQKWIPDTSLDEWILEAGNAYIVEKRSAWDGAADRGLYSRLYGDAALQNHILPLLAVSQDSIYVIVNSASITYGIVDCYVDRTLKDTNPALYTEKLGEFRQELEGIADQQKEFIDLWYRIAKPDKRGQLITNRVILDSLRIYMSSSASAQQEWSAKFGEKASLGVKDFFTPLNLYDTFMFSDGMASGTGVRYYVSKALTERGLSTYAHELTHLLVSSFMLNGYGSRDGMQAEVFTRGMFEPYELNDPPAFNLNLIYNRAASDERLHNAVPGRFQTEEDLQSYMSGILDVIYTLDYAEADAILKKTPEEKKKWFHKLEQPEDTKVRNNQGDTGSVHFLDSVRELTLDEAAGLKTIEDLIRNSILVSRYEVNGTQTTGTLDSNGYYVVPLFSANYAGVQNDNGVSGDVMIRRQAFELLAEYGYYGGMVPYISNQYREAARAEQKILSDTYILKKIFGSTYGSMADFKKAMFQKRIEKVDELRPVTIQWKNQSVRVDSFEKLSQLMKEAVESDLVNVNVLPGGSNNIRAHATQVEQLKAEIFRAYLFKTKDFADSIYGIEEEPEEPTPAPTVEPTETPTPAPTPTAPAVPTAEPTTAPTGAPTATPETTPPAVPTVSPTIEPSAEPSGSPGVVPTVKPSVSPDAEPTIKPSVSPGTSGQPPESPLPEEEDDEDSDQDSDSDKEDDSDAAGIVKKSGPLLARVSSAGTSQVIRWNSISSADGYYIYGAKGNGKVKLLRTVGKKVLRWKRKGLKKGTQYKYYIAAYRNMQGKRTKIVKSLTVSSVTKGGKYGNPVKVQMKKSSVSLRLRKKTRLNAKVTGKRIKKAGKKLRYISAGPSTASVSKKGVVTGIRPGTCYVYCIAENGIYKKVRIKVKR